MTHPEIDQHLNEVALKQLTCKPGPMRRAALVIAEAAIDMREFWPDDLLFDEGNDNCIGSAFRLLAKANIIERTGEFRRSHRKGSAGRTVFGYRLVSAGLANTFIRRNSHPEPVHIGPAPTEEQWNGLSNQLAALRKAKEEFIATNREPDLFT